jgi:hypothetical protein
MKHFVKVDGACIAVEYLWQANHRWCRLFGHASETSIQPGEGSLEQFISEHYWGYTKRLRDSLEYEVAHVPWKVSKTAEAGFEGEIGSIYGAEFARALQDSPASAFIADGSMVSVHSGRRFS